ncbi:MAG: nucleic acid-binding protein [Spirochaetes bacterium GWF1_31_7]|nr:MAG: nucleic acid-binding protein [Spirochaetes bacterium GWE1_32_154]OHD48950.1 MAG: nucleic acid-binding protein [Spirochaetes bacterium GWE2_31_10]OHD51890.1 MAG: nucleic acid-binding protein [Spirochaetes bacterium GWF1_31_7]OHD75118.1 MAG: nucleic acid-binding protein [Spirochaetes bacterium RIFOXYB1_FULL_32_8]HBD93767.1 VapC toxin family PIN domain ribonuclease [Spirochaetia bacterium]
MAFLIDTDILIYSLKGNRQINNWMYENQNIPKFISVITFGELMYGARKSQHPEKNLATAIRISELFPIIDVNRGVIEVFGELKAKLEKDGNRIDDMDLLIASTAIYMNMSLVTNNKNHFSIIPDLVLEKWEEIKS